MRATLFDFHRVMALVAHADDELAAAGTLARFVETADVRLVVASVPDLDKSGQRMGLSAQRLSELEASATILGVDWIMVGMDEQDILWNMETTIVFDREVQEWKPELIITNRTPDTHVGHDNMAKIARSICRKNRISLWEMSQAMPGGIESDALRTNLYVNVTAQYDRKVKAIDAYRSQVARYPEWEQAQVDRDRYQGWLLRQEGEKDVMYAESFRIQKMAWL